MLAACMSSRTRACPITALANAASAGEKSCAVPMMVALPPPCCHSQCLSAMLWNGRSESTQQRSLPIVPLSPLPAAPREVAATGFPPAVEAAAPASNAAAALPAGSVADRDRVVAAMEKSGWVQAKAARLLGLTPRQIGYALKKYGIEVKRL